MTRKQVMDAIAATGPQATATGFAYMVLSRLFPEKGASVDLESEGWHKSEKPVWSAFWTDGEEIGFVSRVVVNDPTTFLSTDSEGRDRRLPVAGKRFFVLPGGG